MDMINNPPHYNKGDIETIEYIKDILTNNNNLDAYEGYLLGNITKYLGTRLGDKSTIEEDSQKAEWYLNKLIEYQSEKVSG